MSSSNKVGSYIEGFGDWRGVMLQELRLLINKASFELEEDFKWGVPVWTNNGLICAISGFKNHVKLNFFKGVYLPDPKQLFNSGLDSKEHRSINLSQGDNIDKIAVEKLLSAAVAYNQEK